jgi:hypothetical protein
MGTIFVPYPYPNRGIPHGLAGIGSPLTSLIRTVKARFKIKLLPKYEQLLEAKLIFTLITIYRLAKHDFNQFFFKNY